MVVRFGVVSSVVACGGNVGLSLNSARTDTLDLDKHANFVRDFRGDTVHHSAMLACSAFVLLLIASGCDAAGGSACKFQFHAKADAATTVSHGGGLVC